MALTSEQHLLISTIYDKAAADRMDTIRRSERPLLESLRMVSLAYPRSAEIKEARATSKWRSRKGPAGSLDRSLKITRSEGAGDLASA